MNHPDQLCVSCMNKLGNDTICPFCGYDNDTPNPEGTLPVGTLLQDRYRLGRALSRNGEGITYMGYDIVKEEKVHIREYMPTTVATREEGDPIVHIIKGCETQFKALLSDFVDLAKSLAKLVENPCIIRIRDIFAENGTVYYVENYFSGITITEFLRRCGGEVSGEQAIELFLPLMEAISGLHAANIYHRAINPENILVNKNGDIKLTGFCISAARTAKSELECELYNGYAAPEQYKQSSWQGTWTDVYGMAATLYKTITGTKPPESAFRYLDDTLLEVDVLVPSTPKQISRAIAKALAIDVDDRTSTMKDFVEALTSDAAPILEPSEEEGEVIAPVTSPKAKKGKKKKGKGKKVLTPAEQELKVKNGKAFLVTAGICSVILICIAVLFIYLFYHNRNSKDANSSEPSVSTVSESSEGTISKVPNFVGQMLTAVKDTKEYTELGCIVENDYDETYPEGSIYRQEPDPGTEVTAGTVVKLYVSKGSKKIKVPPIIGKDLAAASKALAELEVSNFETIDVYDEGGVTGTVVRMNYNVGDEITPSTDRLILYVLKASESSAD